jgi:flagella basal body P-ring formation protein FlgA
MPFPVLLLALQQACVQVSGDRITAGDLAPVITAFERLDPATPLGYAPMIGVVRWLGRKDLAAAFGGPGAAPELPAGICVVRKTVRPNESMLIDAMRKALPPDATVSILRGPAGAVAEGELVFSCSGMRPTGLPGVYSWSGRVRPAGGGRSVSVSAVVKIRIQRPILIAKRSLPAGSTIAEGDLAVEIREVGWPPPDLPGDPAVYVGWRTKRPLEAGDAIDRRWLAAPLAAKPGSRVALSVEQPGARLRVEALALTGGRTGDTIFVKSPFAAVRVRARLTGPGEAVLAEEAIRR